MTLLVALSCIIALSALPIRGQAPGGPGLEGAFIFGGAGAVCAGGGIAGHPPYAVVGQFPNQPQVLEYDPVRGWGFEVTDPGNPGRNGFARFGPMDETPNQVDAFDGMCPDRIYESFIGFADFSASCDEGDVPAPDEPCPIPEGGVFRVDVPNGFYRFAGVFGDPAAAHATRIVAEDGGSGGPLNLGANHVVLVANFDQAQYEPGVLAAVGFDAHLPPQGDRSGRDPSFVAFDADGAATNCAPRSPVLQVTSGFLRIHALRGSSRPGVRAPDRSGGGDLILLEIWRVDDPIVPPCAGMPAIEVSRAELDFGEVEIGDATVLDLEISNAGNAPLEIAEIAFVAGTDAAFEKSAGPDAAILAPGESAEVEIRFTPAGPGAHSGSLRITSDDPVHPEVEVPLAAEGVPACLAFGDTFDATLRPGDVVELCFRSSGGEEGSVLAVELTGRGAGVAEEGNLLYTRWGEPPSREIFDGSSVVPFSSDQRVVSSDLEDTELHVRIEGAVFGDVENEVRLTTRVLGIALCDLFPGHAANAGVLVATVHGGGFDDQTEFELTRGEGAGAIGASAVEIISSARIEAAFDLAGRSPGRYDLRAVSDDGETAVLFDAFELVPAGRGAVLETRFSGPESFRRGRTRQIDLLVRNAGDEPLPAPVLRIVPPATTESVFRLSSDEEFRADSIDVTVSDPRGTRGVLLPSRDFIKVPIVFRSELVGEDRFVVRDAASRVELASKKVRIVAAVDPNEKDGPAGTGDGGDLLVPEDEIGYVVRFANVASDQSPGSAAPLLRVAIADELDPDLDPATVALGSVTIGHDGPFDLPRPLWFSASAGLRAVSSRVVTVKNSTGEYRASIAATLEIDEEIAGRREARIEWEIGALDPELLGPGEGLLPPRRFDAPRDELDGENEGTVAFTVRARSPDDGEEEIENGARIVFDDESPISTNVVRHRIVLPPPPPAEPYPPDGDGTSVPRVAAGEPLVLRWVPVEAALGYVVRMWPDCGEELAVEVEVDAPRYTPSGLRAETLYCWQVVAIGEIARTEGPRWRFRTDASDATRFVRGDADADGSIDITDPIFLLGFLFLGGRAPPCLDAADVDDRGGEQLAITDPIYLLSWLFRGGPAPPAPSTSMTPYGLGDCGFDPSPDALGCGEFPACE